MVEFKYEYLLEYCFAWGRIGHSTQVCIKKYETTHGPLNSSLRAQITYVFYVLEGDTNLWAKNLFALWHVAPRLFPFLTQVIVTLHAMSVFGTRMGRVIGVVLVIDLGNLVPLIGMRIMSPLPL